MQKAKQVIYTSRVFIFVDRYLDLHSAIQPRKEMLITLNLDGRSTIFARGVYVPTLAIACHNS